jgi:hypothetical protein
VRTLAAFAACAALLAQRDARACSVCLAGDPNFSAQGTASQPAGSVNVYFEVRGWTKQSGSVVEEVADPDADAEAAAPVSPATAAPPAPVPSTRSQRAPHIAPLHAGHEHPGWEDLLEPQVPEAASDASSDDAEEGHDHEHGESTEERNESQRLDLYVAWTPVDRVTLTLGVPWAFNTVEERDSEGKARYSLAGLGDVSLGASGVVWRNRDVLPSTWLELRGWVKAPTGRSTKEVDGVLDPHVQPGTGSWDGGAGTALVHRFEWGSLYASSFYRINSEGGLDYEYGDVVLATVALEAPLGHLLGRPALDRVTPGFGFDFRWAQRDESGGETVADTGGSVLYATPSLRIALPAFRATQRAWFRTGVQIPLTDSWLYGEQHEGVVWSAGIGYGF